MKGEDFVKALEDAIHHVMGAIADNPEEFKDVFNEIAAGWGALALILAPMNPVAAKLVGLTAGITWLVSRGMVKISIYGRGKGWW